MKSKLNPITIQRMASLDIAVRCVQIIVFRYSFCACHQSDFLKLLRWNSYSTSLRLKGWSICKILLSHAPESFFLASFVVLTIKASLRLKGWPSRKTTPHSSKSSVWARLMKLIISETFSSLCGENLTNLITTQEIANLDRAVRCFHIMGFSWSICSCHESEILNSLQWNSHLTSLQLKRCPICKILSHPSESLTPASLAVLIIRPTFWSSYPQILT